MAQTEPSKSIQERIEAWGNSSLAPTGLATLLTALHFRPFQVRPMLFVPALLFCSYSNLQGFKIDSAGMTAAASGTYALIAMRRRPTTFMSRFSARGIVRGAAVGLGFANAVAGGWVYANGDREKEKEERKNNPRWVE
ncbi:uncharacterized protein F4807DRAFT_127628 [Annulohypoxylon truncatum]|uniref:uncharacterized protein n=1 Tax=Annulohypoxylon truncatum TaxID=327061 RepID=UPI002008D51E|nr:uncharacterized protein F4807DRAFT_127628 [Annulohypoxylon truncatum]KAI1214418.1 hypothetical protein F4807DRAFT_127628 [Annulohypoxylon truncatum]